ncbi:MAG: hypothetical protein M1840_003966 [Geoglossum simile]|nr:MAG: hypothetical protein M1840_003966 [Geoglossum simile]
MAVSIKRYGLSEVYPGDGPGADLVLVHGLNGHPRDTWTAPGSNAFWPRDLLPKTIPRRVRILTYGYNATASNLLGDTSSDLIPQHAQTLVQELFANRSLGDALRRPITFLCHSLGGIVVKRALDYSAGLRAKTVEHLRSIFVSTSGIIFLSTPHNGADPARWRHMLQSLHETALPSDTPLYGTQLVSALEPQSAALQDINISFAQIMSQFRLFFLHETIKTRFGKSSDFIVDQHSAAPIFEGAEYTGIEATHLDICRFETEDSPGYGVVAEAINRWAKDAVPIIKMRWEYERDLRRRHAFAKASEYVIHCGSGGDPRKWLAEGPPMEEKKERDREKFLSLISTIDSESEHRRLRKLIFRGTCRWILGNPDFKEWFNGGRSSCLWCSGIPGAGKTVLTSVIVHHAKLRRGKSGNALAFFYCTSFDPRTLTALTILGSFIMQLMAQFEQLSKPMPAILTKKAVQARDECRNSIDTDELVEILLAFATNSLETFFILDGLDECIPEEREKMLSFFEQLLQRKVSGSTYRILISSRDDVNVSQEIPSCARLPVHDTDVEGDICEYVSNTVDDLIQKRKLKVHDESLIVDIKERLTIGAQGMFLWVAFQIRDLCEYGTTDFMITQILKKLPNGLNETGPLLVQELEEAIAFGPNDGHWDESKIPNIDIVSTCANLVIVDESEKLVRLAHHTVKEFLFSTELRGNTEFFSFDLDQSDLEIGESCIRYLSFSDFRPAGERPRSYLKYILPPSRTASRHLQALSPEVDSSKYRLLDYARANWIAHTTKILKSSPGWKDFRSLALQQGQPRAVQQPSRTTTGALSNYRQFELAIENGHIPLLTLLRDGSRRGLKDLCEQGVANGMFPLHSVAKKGSESACKLLLKVCDVNVCDAEGRIALHYAVEQKHEKIAVLLLEKRARIDTRDSKGRSALHIAAQSGHEAVVRLLLDRGADANIEDSNGWTALRLAARSGHEAILRLLLDRGVDVRDGRGLALILAAQEGHEEVVRLLLIGGVDLKEGYGPRALLFAAWNGYERIICLLLDSGIDANGEGIGTWASPPLGIGNKVDLLDGVGSTALHLAAYGGHEAIVRLLLKSGADANAKGGSSSTALHGAVRNKHEGIVQLLLEKGADVNVEDNDRRTPLHWAAQRGQEGVVQLLLDGGADVDARNIDEMTALHWAVRKGHEKVVQLLLGRGADIDAKNVDEMTALYWAVQKGHGGVVQLLLDGGADVNAEGVDGMAALHWAARKGHEEVVRLLLNRGANVNGKNLSGSTALHLAAQSGHDVTVRTLLERGADTNTKSINEMTALHWAARKGHEEVVRLLLNRGANVNGKNLSGSTALHLAAQSGHDVELIVRALLERGADINAKDDSGSTALYDAVWKGREAVLRLLLENGADVNATEISIPLHWAVWSGNEALVRLLLEAGTDANVEDIDDGITALNWAVQLGHEAIVRLLTPHTHQPPNTSPLSTNTTSHPNR